MDHLCFVSCVSRAFASVHCCLVVTCWERADLLVLVGDVIVFLYFPLWYPVSGVALDLSFPDLCRLSYFDIARLLGLHYNYYASPSVRLSSIS